MHYWQWTESKEHNLLFMTSDFELSCLIFVLNWNKQMAAAWNIRKILPETLNTHTYISVCV